jgi:hypothetical protein
VAGARSALSVSATGSDTTYSFRANNLSDLANIVAARSNLGLVIGTDIPAVNGSGASGTWSINVSGNAATATSATTASSATNVSGTVAIGNGGTGATNAISARSNLGLAAVAASGSASDLSSGTVANARLPNIASMPGVTIQSDPGGTPSGSAGQMFFYY